MQQAPEPLVVPPGAKIPEVSIQNVPILCLSCWVVHSFHSSCMANTRERFLLKLCGNDWESLWWKATSSPGSVGSIRPHDLNTNTRERNDEERIFVRSCNFCRPWQNFLSCTRMLIAQHFFIRAHKDKGWCGERGFPLPIAWSSAVFRVKRWFRNYLLLTLWICDMHCYTHTLVEWSTIRSKQSRLSSAMTVQDDSSVREQAFAHSPINQFRGKKNKFTTNQKHFNLSWTKSFAKNGLFHTWLAGLHPWKSPLLSLLVLLLDEKCSLIWAWSQAHVSGQTA